jgi:hypothetical protein
MTDKIRLMFVDEEDEKRQPPQFPGTAQAAEEAPQAKKVA